MSEPVKPKWGWKQYLTGVLVGLSVITSWVAAKIHGQQGPESEYGATCAASQVVFEQKRRCGFLDLGELVTVEGTVKKTKTHKDGDRSIDLILDEEYEKYLFYEGRQTRKYLHVEFMPCERLYTDVDVPLAEVLRRYDAKTPTRARITGRWAYDGVDHRGEWKDQLGNCLGGREADPDVGWTEIHPGYSIEIIE